MPSSPLSVLLAALCVALVGCASHQAAPASHSPAPPNRTLQMWTADGATDSSRGPSPRERIAAAMERRQYFGQARTRSQLHDVQTLYRAIGRPDRTRRLGRAGSLELTYLLGKRESGPGDEGYGHCRNSMEVSTFADKIMLIFVEGFRCEHLPLRGTSIPASPVTAKQLAADRASCPRCATDDVGLGDLDGPDTITGPVLTTP